MEAWKEEMYHGVLGRIGTRARTIGASTIRGIGGRTNSDGTWKQHKYIRKEGNRYIYPDDLKNKSRVPGKSSNNTQRASTAINISNSSGPRSHSQTTHGTNNSVIKKADSTLYTYNLKYQMLRDGIKIAGSTLNKMYNAGKLFIDGMKKNAKNNTKVGRSSSAYSVLHPGETIDIRGLSENSSYEPSSELFETIAEAALESSSDKKKK